MFDYLLLFTNPSHGIQFHWFLSDAKHFITKQLTHVYTNLQIFICGLWNIIHSYQPNPLTAHFFFVTAACAAFAFVSTYLFAIYGAAAGGVYGMVKMAETYRRIVGGGGRRDIRGVTDERSGGQNPWGNQNQAHYQ
mmetsp:Transcript_3382/g.6207  ORF Transcript_3382/g.6207 Transcript_3382/m.6207 type:complete len:136 (+) Transcript_3382:42-449(+)